MFKDFDFRAGDTLTIQKRVTREDSSLNYGSGQIDSLFATPSLVALMIEAASKLLDPKLPEGYITVGRRVDVTHEMPSKLGTTISLKVTVSSLEGNHIQLDMEAYDDIGKIGHGIHERVVVNKSALELKAANRIAEIGEGRKNETV